MEQAKIEKQNLDQEIAFRKFQEQQRRDEMMKPEKKTAYKETNPVKPDNTVNLNELYSGIDNIDSAPKAYQV